MSLEIVPCAIPEVKLLRPKRHADERGFFSEVYSESAYREAGIAARFVQDNYSRSLGRGVVRGLHFQIPPFEQEKLLWVTRGRIFDVVVDLRRGAATYGSHVAVTLSAEDWVQLYVPAGFAHGFCTLGDEADVAYKVSAPYSAAHDRGLFWNDPALAIPWPVEAAMARLSPRDRKQPRLAELPAYFQL
jgi:dTDP-4-dehydrorhamnose 3,5-epimerase